MSSCNSAQGGFEGTLSELLWQIVFSKDVAYGLLCDAHSTRHGSGQDFDCGQGMLQNLTDKSIRGGTACV